MMHMESQPQGPLRAAITSAYRRPEPACLPPLLEQARLPAAAVARATALARRLVGRLRAKGHGSGVEGLIHEYSLSSQEGVALMCMAEALLRVPDDDTRDALIRDKIGGGDWQAHLGHSPSPFVNAATWGLLLTGKLTATHSERGLSAALTRMVAKGGEPLIRHGVNLAMRLMGEQFVSGQTIDEALDNGRAMEAKGFRYSYDMLGEAAITAAQAAKYLADYERAIESIGRASAGRGIYDGSGISVKLSALHPRYEPLSRARVLEELPPKLLELARMAKGYQLNFTVDAEEADRLELSLEVIAAVLRDSSLAGWDGFGLAVQCYQKRAGAVIEWIAELAAALDRLRAWGDAAGDCHVAGVPPAVSGLCRGAADGGVRAADGLADGGYRFGAWRAGDDLVGWGRGDWGHGVAAVVSAETDGGDRGVRHCTRGTADAGGRCRALVSGVGGLGAADVAADRIGAGDHHRQLHLGARAGRGAAADSGGDAGGGWGAAGILADRT